MRAIALAVILTAAIATPSLGEDSFLQIWHPLGDAAAAAASAHGPTYDECFQLGWLRGVHVERGEWDEFYQQCAAGAVPFSSGMRVDSVKLDSGHPPHS